MDVGFEGFTINVNIVPGEEINPDIVPYFIPVTPTITGITAYEQDIGKTTQGLADLFQQYADESQVPYSIKCSYMPKRTTKFAKPIQNFVFRKICKTQKKLNKLKEKFYSEHASEASKIVSYLIKLRSGGTPLLFDVEGYKRHIEHKYRNVPEILSNVKHILSMNSFLQHTDTKIDNSTSISTMKEILNNSTKNVQKMLVYSPYGEFDAAFEDFVEYTMTIRRFDILVNEITKNLDKKVIDMTDIVQVNKSFNMLFLPENSKQRVVMHFAIVRILFNEICLVPNFFLFSGETDDIFFKKCTLMKKQTPTQLKIGKELMKPEMMNMPFEKVVEGSEELRGAVLTLNSLHFLTNPYDIAYFTFNAIKAIDNFVCSNKKVKAKASSMMSFDDVFSLFCPVLSINPPKNCVSIATFMLNVKGLNFSASLDFGKLILSSSVNYISELEFDK